MRIKYDSTIITLTMKICPELSKDILAILTLLQVKNKNFF